MKYTAIVKDIEGNEIMAVHYERDASIFGLIDSMINTKKRELDSTTNTSFRQAPE